MLCIYNCILAKHEFTFKISFPLQHWCCWYISLISWTEQWNLTVSFYFFFSPVFTFWFYCTGTAFSEWIFHGNIYALNNYANLHPYHMLQSLFCVCVSKLIFWEPKQFHDITFNCTSIIILLLEESKLEEHRLLCLHSGKTQTTDGVKRIVAMGPNSFGSLKHLQFTWCTCSAELKANWSLISYLGAYLPTWILWSLRYRARKRLSLSWFPVFVKILCARQSYMLQCTRVKMTQWGPRRGIWGWENIINIPLLWDSQPNNVEPIWKIKK